MAAKEDVYTRITNRMIAQLEKGVVPWLKPWDVKEAKKSTFDIWPRNAVTDYHYSGANVFMCWFHMADLGFEFGQTQPAFLTYKQAQRAGGHVKKGEKSTFVLYYPQVQAKEPVEGEDEKPRWRTAAIASAVFHISQCSFPDNVLLKGHHPYEPPVGLQDDLAWQRWLDATQAKIKVGGLTACYRPREDRIDIPSARAFKNRNDFKAVMCHELGHWTGHESRLNRDLSSMYGVTGYAFEELIAELTAAFTCARLGLRMTELRHAEYLATWLKALKDDKKFIVQASSKAGKATDYIMNLTKEALANAKPKRRKEHHGHTGSRPKGIHRVRRPGVDSVLRSPTDKVPSGRASKGRSKNGVATRANGGGSKKQDQRDTRRPAGRAQRPSRSAGPEVAAKRTRRSGGPDKTARNA